MAAYVNAFAADPGQPVVRINGVTLHQSDLSCAVEATLARQLTSRKEDRNAADQVKERVDSKETLRSLIAIELLYQESLKHRFPGLLEESNERYSREVKRLGGEEKLASTLQCNNMSPEQFKKAIFRNLSIKRLLDEVVYSRIQVSDKEIRDYYETNQNRFRKPESMRVRQILIKAPSEPDEEAWRHVEKKANTIYKDASDGTDFIRLVRIHSEDPASASVGGDMGALERSNLHSIFGSLTIQMKEGSVSKPVRSRRGFHIFKIVSTIPSRTRPFEEVQQHITTRLRREKAREMISGFISDLESRAEIEIIKTDDH